MLDWTYFTSPFGPLKLVADQTKLVAVLWNESHLPQIHRQCAERSSDTPILQETSLQLDEYFKSRRTSFSVPLRIEGTHFQKMLYYGLQTIAFGETKTYGELAKELDRPKASRAVGAGAAKNPLSILVPCHRLVGRNQALTGFAGGLDIKRELLAFEAGRLDFTTIPPASVSHSQTNHLK